MVAKEQGLEKAEGASETLIFKIDVPANRFVVNLTYCFVTIMCLSQLFNLISKKTFPVSRLYFVAYSGFNCNTTCIFLYE